MQTAGIAALVLVLLVGGGFGAFLYLKAEGRKSLMQSASTAAPDLGDMQEDSGTVSYNGKRYKYNEDMINILCMGIDQYTGEIAETASEAGAEDLAENGETESTAVTGESGQADTIFLLALNTKDNTMTVKGISRDTMTAVKTYDHQGNYLGENTNHLGLAYAFGDGGAQSGELMTGAVSKLMYDLPIHGYAAIRLDAIQKINDSVGGVTVTLPEDMVLGGQSYQAGTTVLLEGVQAQNFVQSRDVQTAGSNNLRMERQKLYLLSFVDEARAALKKHPTLAADLYKSLTADMVTSIGLDEAVYLASLLPDISFSLDDISMLAGETKKGAVYEEFYLDEDALLETIFDTFYIEVN